MKTNKQESVAFLCTSVLASFSRETKHNRIYKIHIRDLLQKLAHMVKVVKSVVCKLEKEVS